MAIREGNRWYPFWQNLKQGYDAFEISRRPPVVGVKDQRYVIFLDDQFVPADSASNRPAPPPPPA